MLSFTSEQIEAIGEKQFLARLTEYMANGFPGAGEKLRTPIGQATLEKVLADARIYGLETELELAYYAMVAWNMGVDFHSKLPAFYEILTSKTRSPSQKADEIQKLAHAILKTLEDSMK